MSLLNDRLAALRGPGDPQPHDARTLAALSANPGCNRRAVLDAAGINKDDIARCLGQPRPLTKSQLAMRSGVAFEQEVKADGCAELLRLLREVLALPLPEAAHTDLAAIGTRDEATRPLRHTRTRNAILDALRDDSPSRTLLDHPLLKLTVAGNPVYLEPDLIAFQINGVFHIVEIKSFAVIDGQADPDKVATAVTQGAAYILALRELLAAEGIAPDRVSDDIILIMPRNFTRRPTADRVDARKKIASLTRQLNRLASIDAVLEHIPTDITLDLAYDPDGNPTRDPKELAEHLQTIEARYTSACRRFCDLALHCRSEAQTTDSIDVLGTAVRDDLGGVDTITTALQLARGTRTPSADQADLAVALRHAQTVRTQLGSAA